MKSVVIENVGAIRELSIPVPDDGGVVVLRGPNGIGKSTALDAVAALTSKEKPPGLRDGAKRGRIEGLGATISVGLSSRRAGELEVRTLEGRLDVSDLVDPGITSVEAADARRIRALVAVSGVTASSETFADLVPGGADEIETIVPEKLLGSGDILDIAGAVKRGIERKARDLETQAENVEGRAKTLASQAGEVSEDEPHDADRLQSDFEDAVRRQQELQAAMDAWGRAQNTIVECETALALQADVEDIDVLRARSKTLAAQFDEQQQLLAELEKQLEQARANLQQTRNDIRLIDQQMTAARLDRERVAALRKMLDEAKAVPEVERNQIEAARLCVDMARKAVERGAVVREALGRKASAESAFTEVKRLRHQAEKLRANAAATDSILSDLVASLGVPLSVKVIDGRTRLVTETDRGLIPFADLSAGERWRVALDIAIEAVGVRGLLVIRQEAWEGLDPANRAEIAAHCQKRGAVLLTAEADGGESIAVEVMR